MKTAFYQKAGKQVSVMSTRAFWDSRFPRDSVSAFGAGQRPGLGFSLGRDGDANGRAEGLGNAAQHGQGVAFVGGRFQRLTFAGRCGVCERVPFGRVRPLAQRGNLQRAAPRIG